MSVRLAIFVVLASLFTTLSARAAERDAAVITAHRLFPVLLRALKLSGRYKTLTPEQSRMFIDVQVMSEIDELPLEFSDDEQLFDLPDEWTRLMITPKLRFDGDDELGTITVNRRLLNQNKTETPLVQLFKILFHEWARKTAVEPDLALSDQVAQWVEDQAESFVREYTVDERTRVITFSVPRDLSGYEMRDLPLNRAQQTFALLVNHDERISDYTEELNRALLGPATMVRSAWSALLTHVLPFMQAMLGGLDQLLRAAEPLVRGFAQASGQKVNGFAELKERLQRGVAELRTLELHDVRTIVSGEDLFLNLRAVYTIGLSKDMQIEMNEGLSGLPKISHMPSPLTVNARLRLKDPHASRFAVALRPQTDPFENARVKQVIRGPLGEVSRLVVEFKAAKAPKRAHLAVAYDEGYRMIAGRVRAGAAPGLYVAEFEPRWSSLPDGRALIAGEVFVDSTRSLYLTALIELRSADDSGARVSHAPAPAVLVDSVGAWGSADHQPRFRTTFDGSEPMDVHDALKGPPLTFPHTGLTWQFDLSGAAPVREVRWHFRRESTVLEKQFKEGVPAEYFEIKSFAWDGDMIPFIGAGGAVKVRESFEVLSTEDIWIQSLPGDVQRVRAVFNVPFVPAAELKTKEQAHSNPRLMPVSLDVVLANGQTVSHSFGTPVPSSCEATMSAGPEAPGDGVFTSVNFKYEQRRE